MSTVDANNEKLTNLRISVERERVRLWQSMRTMFWPPIIGLCLMMAAWAFSVIYSAVATPEWQQALTTLSEAFDKISERESGTPR